MRLPALPTIAIAAGVCAVLVLARSPPRRVDILQTVLPVDAHRQVQQGPRSRKAHRPLPDTDPVLEHADDARPIALLQAALEGALAPSGIALSHHDPRALDALVHYTGMHPRPPVFHDPPDRTGLVEGHLEVVVVGEADQLLGVGPDEHQGLARLLRHHQLPTHAMLPVSWDLEAL